MNSLTCPPDQFEAYEYQEARPEAQNCDLTPANLKSKVLLEERRFVQTRAFFNANWGDNDSGYASYINE